MDILNRGFYARNTETVAKDLLGMLILKRERRQILIARIVETEAYFGLDDPASHASRGITPRSAIMYGDPGHAYIYLNYGVHWLLNFVTETHGHPGAVLIRSVEPVAGFDLMRKRRPGRKDKDLTNGPGKLTRALGIDNRLNGHDLADQPLQVADDASPRPAIVCTERIGISVAKERLLRYYIRGNTYVSRY